MITVNAMVCSRLSHLRLLLMYSPCDAQCTQTLTHKHVHCTQNYNNIIIITMFYTQANSSEHDINLARSGWYLFFAVQLIPPHNITNCANFSSLCTLYSYFSLFTTKSLAKLTCNTSQMHASELVSMTSCSEV